MVNPAREEFAQLIKHAITAAYPNLVIGEGDIAYSITYSSGTDWDISSSIALRLAKAAKMPPMAVAETLSKAMNNGKLIISVSSLNGYINAKLDEKELARIVINDIVAVKEKYAASEIGKGKKVLIEYPGINPNKPWHLGHLRNPLLGDSISRIMKLCSYTVE